jgi:hypothetical protein
VTPRVTAPIDAAVVAAVTSNARLESRCGGGWTIGTIGSLAAGWAYAVVARTTTAKETTR